MKQIAAISIFIFLVCASGRTQTLIENSVNQTMNGEDPCLTQMHKIVKKADFLVETDSSEYAIAKGLSEEAQSKLYGRFFKVTALTKTQVTKQEVKQVISRSNSKVYWTIPYAQGQACIVRDIKRL